MRQAKQVRKELIIGLVIWTIPVALILTIIATHRLAMIAGVVVGALTAAGLFMHMYRHLDIALDMDARHAQTHTQFAAVQRILIMGVILAISMIYSQYIHPVGVVFGMFGMKISAFIYPLLHKYFINNKHKAGGKPSNFKN